VLKCYSKMNSVNPTQSAKGRISADSLRYFLAGPPLHLTLGLSLAIFGLTSISVLKIFFLVSQGLLYFFWGKKTKHIGTDSPSWEAEFLGMI